MSHSPSSSIPLEILQEIFLDHRSLVHEPRQPGVIPSSDDRSMKRVPGYEWISVSHVCRRWRAAAIFCPPLWTQITVTHSTEWMSEIITRSGSMPLQVIADLGASVSDKTHAFKIILAALDRIQSLRLSGYVDAETAALLANPARSLEHLVLDHISLPVPAGLKHTADELAYFPYLLHRDLTPRLAHLELDAFQPRLRVPCTDTLKHLVFRHRVAGTLLGRRYTSPCLHGLLAALQAMPALESLDFEREAHAMLGPAAEAELEGGLLDVVLPALRSLRVHATAEECVALMNTATLPALESFALSCARNGMEYPAALGPALAHTLAVLPPTHGLSVARFTGSGFHRYLRFTGRPSRDASGSGAEGHTFDVMLDRGYGREEVVPLLAGCLPLQDVRELQVESQTGPVESAWRSVLDAVPNLESVAIGGLLARQRLPEVRACVEAILGAEDVGKDSEVPAGRRIPTMRVID